MKKKFALVGAMILPLLFTDLAFARDEFDSASPVDVISGDEIRELPGNARSILDFVNLVPGVNRDPTDGGTADIYIRGIGNDRGTVLIDGIDLDSGNGISATGFPPDYIDRVEILNGPQGSLFGADKTGGVVNIVTNDKYTGHDLFGSWLLSDLNRDLSQYQFTVESNEECDATHGSESPAWTFTDKWDYGKPKISYGGEYFEWGSKSDGYDSGTVFRPSTPLPGFGDLLADYDPFTYTRFEELKTRINIDPDAHEQDKRDYINMLMFGAAFGGPGTLSDQASGLQQFDADKTFDDFKEFSRTRTDADRANFGSMLRGAMLPSPTTATPTTAAPTPTASPVSTTPGPFEQYPYPPDYAFDFNGTTPEQKKKVLELIRERDQARADNSYYSDYLRSDGQSAEMIAEDEALAAAALRTRDAKNQELREYWEDITNPLTAPPAQPATPPLQVADEVPGYKYQKDGYGYGSWNLELHIEYDDLDAAKSGSDIGIDVYGVDYTEKFSLPFTFGSLFETELDASAGSSKAFADENDVATVKGAIDGTRLTNRLRLQFDMNAETDGGVAFGARFRAAATKPREPENDDWQIFLDYDPKMIRNGPTIGLKYKFNAIDSMYQEYIPDWDYTKPNEDESPKTQESLDFFSNYSGGEFSFGGKSFRTFSASESLDLDWGALEYLKGQTYTANNECGDSALPTDGGGYLTAEQSQVKSVEDQWAFERVGLSGDEPSLDEFAKPVIVGVIDTGIDWNHLDFSWDNLWQNADEIPDNGVDDDGNGYIDDVIGWNFTGENNKPWDRDGHGTFVSGIIAAKQGNDIGIDGINSHAKIMVLKALNNFGRTRATYVAQAIVYGADNGAQILNLSVTGPGFPKIVQDAVDYAESKGVLVVNAAGNRAEDIDAGELSPLERVLTVAATGQDDKRAAFSNIGNAVDISAPGIDIVSLRARATDFMFNSSETPYQREDAFLGEDRRYYRSTGTSFATPIVTGIASLMLSNNPGLEPADLRRILEQSARDVETPGRDRFTGYGIVDVRAALAADPAYYIHAAIPEVSVTNIDGQNFVEVIGVAEADQFATASLEIGEGEAPESWVSAGVALTSPIRMGSVGQIPAAQFATATTWTIRLLVKHQDGSMREARYVIDL